MAKQYQAYLMARASSAFPNQSGQGWDGSSLIDESRHTDQ
jgi:hypothetical protein